MDFRDRQSMVKLVTPLLALLLVGCSDQPSSDARDYTDDWDGAIPNVRVPYMPKFQELPALKAAGYSGSSEAALSVMLFHVNDKDDESQCYWARIAAQNGSAAGMKNTSICYRNLDYSRKSKIRSNFWIQRMKDPNLQSIYSQADGLNNQHEQINVWNLSSHIERAYSGSISSAISLAMYYKEREEICYWYSIATENGSRHAANFLAECFAKKDALGYSVRRKQFWTKVANK